MHKQLLAKRFIAIRCKCNRALKILNPYYNAGNKTHIHCDRCNLVWHLDSNGSVWCHIWKFRGLDVHFMKTYISEAEIMQEQQETLQARLEKAFNKRNIYRTRHNLPPLPLTTVSK